MDNLIGSKNRTMHVAEPPTIERQMLLAQFACAALTGLLSHSSAGAYSAEETTRCCFSVANEMLAEFDRRVKR